MDIAKIKIKLNKLKGKKRQLAFADFIASLPWLTENYSSGRKKKKDLPSFAMNRTHYYCGTPACMRGWEKEFSPKHQKGNPGSWLGLDRGVEWLIYYPDDYYFEFGLASVTPKRAATALRRYIKGERNIKKLWHTSAKPVEEIPEVPLWVEF